MGVGVGGTGVSVGYGSEVGVRVLVGVRLEWQLVSRCRSEWPQEWR